MFKSIKDIIPKSIKKAGLEDKVQDALVLSRFSRIVENFLGSGIEGKLKPLYLKQQFLVIACLDDELVEKLRNKENEIVNKINQEFKKAVIRGLRFLD